MELPAPDSTIRTDRRWSPSARAGMSGGLAERRTSTDRKDAQLRFGAEWSVRLPRRITVSTAASNGPLGSREPTLAGGAEQVALGGSVAGAVFMSTTFRSRIVDDDRRLLYWGTACPSLGRNCP
jgi:hypothetical protein